MNFSLSSTMTNMHVGRYKKRSTSGWSFRSVPENISFLSFYRHQYSRGALGSQGRKRGKKKKKVYKIFKSTKTSPIACGNKFPLTFYFRFVRNGSRMERCTNERWGRRKKNCKKRKEDVRWLKCRRGTSRNVSTTNNDLFVR